MKPENLKKIFCVMLSASLLLPGTVGAKGSDEKSDDQSKSIFTSENLKPLGVGVGIGAGVPAAAAFIWGLARFIGNHGENDKKGNLDNTQPNKKGKNNGPNTATTGNGGGSNHIGSCSNGQSSDLPQPPVLVQPQGMPDEEFVKNMLHLDVIPGLKFYYYHSTTPGVSDYWCYLITNKGYLEKYLRYIHATLGTTEDTAEGIILKYANRAFVFKNIEVKETFCDIDELNNLVCNNQNNMLMHFHNAATEAMRFPVTQENCTPQFNKTDIYGSTNKLMINRLYVESVSSYEPYTDLPDNWSIKMLSTIGDDDLPAAAPFITITNTGEAKRAANENIKDAAHGYANGLRWYRVKSGRFTYRTYVIEDMDKLISFISGITNMPYKELKIELLKKVISLQNRFIKHTPGKIDKSANDQAGAATQNWAENIVGKTAANFAGGVVKKALNAAGNARNLATWFANAVGADGWDTSTLFNCFEKEFITMLDNTVFCPDNKKAREDNTTLKNNDFQTLNNESIGVGNVVFKEDDPRLSATKDGSKIKKLITCDLSSDKLGDNSLKLQHLFGNITRENIRAAYEIDINTIFDDSSSSDADK